MSEEVVKDLGDGKAVTADELCKSLLSLMYDCDNSVIKMEGTITDTSNPEVKTSIVYEVKLISINGEEVGEGEDG